MENLDNADIGPAGPPLHSRTRQRRTLSARLALLEDFAAAREIHPRAVRLAARVAGTSPATVSRYLRRVRTYGVMGLQPRRHFGRGHRVDLEVELCRILSAVQAAVDAGQALREVLSEVAADPRTPGVVLDRIALIS